LDVQALPLPVARTAIRANNAQGGINVRVDPDHPRSTIVELFDKGGIYLTTNAERKIETIFFREDYGRTDMDEVGEIEYTSRTIEQYTQQYFSRIKERDVQRRRFKVVVDYAYGRISTVLPEILGRLGCDVIALNAYSDYGRAPKTPT
ncbi:hypothetical protein WB334_25835, partial [Escherichia coli]|uniref:hypothetical protein n=1 Tax=Escherichia coli TaxID=562 RepID=UPI0021573555